MKAKLINLLVAGSIVASPVFASDKTCDVRSTSPVNPPDNDESVVGKVVCPLRGHIWRPFVVGAVAGVGATLATQVLIKKLQKH